MFGEVLAALSISALSGWVIGCARVRAILRRSLYTIS